MFPKQTVSWTTQNNFSQFVKTRIYFSYLPDGHESIWLLMRAAVDLRADFSRSTISLTLRDIPSIILATRFRLRKLPEVTLAHSGMPNRATRYGRTHFNSVTVIGVRSGSRFSRRRRSLSFAIVGWALLRRVTFLFPHSG